MSVVSLASAIARSRAKLAAWAGLFESKARCVALLVGGAAGAGYRVGETVVMGSECWVLLGASGVTQSAFDGVRGWGKSVGLIEAESDDGPIAGCDGACRAGWGYDGRRAGSLEGKRVIVLACEFVLWIL